MDATGDVVLRPPEISDAEPLHLLFRDPEVMRWIGDGRVRDLAYYEDFVHHQRELFRTKGYCFHTLCVEGRVAGFVGLHDWNAEWGPTGSVELGYRLGKRYWGRGIAFDAARRVLSDIPQLPLTAMIAVGNTRSERLALRLGFVAAESYRIPGGGEARCHRRGAGTGS